MDNATLNFFPLNNSVFHTLVCRNKFNKFLLLTLNGGVSLLDGCRYLDQKDSFNAMIMELADRPESII